MAVVPEASSQIECAICGKKTHAMHLHLKEHHPEMSIDQYRTAYPDAPLLSDYAAKVIAEREAGKKGKPPVVKAESEESSDTVAATPDASGKFKRDALHTLFGLKGKEGLSSSGKPIPVTVMIPDETAAKFIPPRDEDYVFTPGVLKDALIGLELNIPTYVWGHAGTGKSTLIEQICSITQRAMIRVQHSANTEEAHITGQWTVKGGETVFEPGLLLLAMKNGWVYVADEYDFASPSVLAVYQAVLEGKACVTKEADEKWRIVQPHEGFRFMATGNSNGSGDESGLYQGVMIQNAANYERFGMVINMPYMKESEETRILSSKLGLEKEDANKLVKFANLVREQFNSKRMMATISPRALLYAGTIGLRKGCFKAGIECSFANRLSSVDREVVKGLAQRVFG